MSDSVASPKEAVPRLSSLFSRTHLPGTVMLGGGVALHAVETYITATLMPSIVRDIGGLPLFAWATTLYVAASVLGSIFIAVRPASVSLNRAYVSGALLFGAGSLVCALAPAMEVVLLGRAVQGLGAGLLVTLGYSFIRFVYPERLWNVATTLYAAIWGVATFLGPTIGGVFAAGSAWREAFLVLIPIAGLMAVAAPRLLPSGEDDGRLAAGAPFAQILLLLAAVLLVSFAGSVETVALRGGLAGAAALAVAAMLIVERQARARLLPNGAARLASPLARIYLVMLLLLVALASDIYIPYFLQDLHGIRPLVSGYLVALIALGWTASAFLVAGLTGRAATLSIAAGALVEAAATGLLVLLLARHNPEARLAILVPASLAVFGMGFGVGLGWAHLVTLVLRLAPEGEKDKASAAITTMQSLGSAFGAALSGVAANSTGLIDPGGVAGTISAATWLYGLFTLPALAAFALSVSLVGRRP
ncbi:MFS transporter [Rhizobium sp. TRM95111]|uniref:MFS transporter n=1 Tax=Rhizobium alarense TaxID=2846851 RepID=UPI001F2D55BE|nr:MFS transporter [Rhizobium alarense]MCF3638516.1 MFS transporter [Rhizobium alarense]